MVESPSELENRIAIVRRKVCQTYTEAHAHVYGWISTWVGVEHAVERSSLYYCFHNPLLSYMQPLADRIKSIISANESLTPGLLYVGIATLSGSIIARNRMLVTRFLLPPIFLFASANHFLPETTGNLSSYLGSLEETYFPSLSEKHDVAKAHTQMTWEKVTDFTASSRDQLNRGTMTAVEKVQEVTGLKLRETFGWTGEKVEGLKATVDEKLVETEKKVEDLVEEIKTHA